MKNQGLSAGIIISMLILIGTLGAFPILGMFMRLFGIMEVGDFLIPILSNIDWLITLLSFAGVIGVYGLAKGIHYFVRNIKRKSKNSSENEREWIILERKYTELQNIITSYQADLSLAIRFPVMNDPFDSITSDMIEVLNKAKSIYQVKDDEVSDSLLSRFSHAVYSLDTHVKRAVNNARRISWDNISLEDRKDFERADNLFKHATDVGNTKEARQNYMMKLEEVIQRINQRNRIDIIPQYAVTEIEQKHDRNSNLHLFDNH